MKPSGPGALEGARFRMTVDISGREMGALRASNWEGEICVRVTFSRKESAIDLSIGSVAYREE